MNISARFNQSPNEKKRYLLDYTAQLAQGEVVTGVTFTITSPTDPVQPPTSFLITSVAITPAGNQVAFFASAGTDLNLYNVVFEATTSLTQVLEDLVVYNIKAKLDA
jgi:hypothetical protein